MKPVRRLDGWAVRAAGVVTALLTAYPPNRLPAQSLFRPEDRVLITDFSHVDAIAASPFLVFAATTRGLTVYDRLARAWRLPATALEGYPTARVRVALADPSGDAVWLDTDAGWGRYDALAHAWQPGIAPPEATGSEALTPEAAFRRVPAADALRALILTDPTLRTARFTCVARSADRQELFFGTDGMGIVRIDAGTAEWERLPFGLLAPGAAGLAEGDGGVWVASRSRPGERRGLSWVAHDLSRDSTVEGGAVPPFSCLDGRRLVVRASALWFGCEGGLLEITSGSYRTRLVDEVLSLAPGTDGVWVGTTHGLAGVSVTGEVRRIETYGRPVFALVASGESLWVATSSGLALLVPGAGELGVPPDVMSQPALQGRVLALARVRDTLVALTPDQFAWRDPVTHDWTLVHARSDLGAITAIAADPTLTGVWIGGTSGLAFWDLPRNVFRVLRVPYDVPAPVRDVIADADYLWVSTGAGLVRFARAAALGQ